MKKQERGFFNLPFRWLYSFDSLRLCDKKKTSQIKKKKKTLFDLKFFYLSQGEEKREKAREEKQRKNNTLNMTNSNLPDESIAREKECCFCKQGKITPLLQKTIPEIEKRKERHNTQKIIKI